MPARGAYDHIFPGLRASFNVRKHAVRRGEIDDCVNVAKLFRRKRSARRVLFFARDHEMMLAFGGHLRHQRSGFAAAQN